MLKNKGELRLQEVYLFKCLNSLFFKFINFMLDQGTIGCPGSLKKLDSRFHGNDNVVYISTFYRCINVKEGKFLFHVYRHIRAGHPEEGMLLSFG
jgi:hypothetical protein